MMRMISSPYTYMGKQHLKPIYEKKLTMGFKLVDLEVDVWETCHLTKLPTEDYYSISWLKLGEVSTNLHHAYAHFQHESSTTPRTVGLIHAAAPRIFSSLANRSQPSLLALGMVPKTCVVSLPRAF
ncbi:hypothetical protein VNO77_25917 [Canavalia gladiata]|uniref:Uncharacterized protein n=1 Tax=Canavalia gladiata TaxID=3824 RepID=A0AAN9Q573_CANGL